MAFAGDEIADENHTASHCQRDSYRFAYYTVGDDCRASACAADENPSLTPSGADRFRGVHANIRRVYRIVAAHAHIVNRLPFESMESLKAFFVVRFW